MRFPSVVSNAWVQVLGPTNSVIRGFVAGVTTTYTLYAPLDCLYPDSMAWSQKTDDFQKTCNSLWKVITSGSSVGNTTLTHYQQITPENHHCVNLSQTRLAPAMYPSSLFMIHQDYLLCRATEPILSISVPLFVHPSTP